MFDIFVALVTMVLLAFAFTAILNTFTFPRLSAEADLHSGLSKVSVCIPARNEALVIADTIRAWLAQDYPDLELLILDDDSNDGTTDVARKTANGDSRLTILRGEPLPEGWKGKNWACHQLSQRAKGEILIFTDADVRWQPGALSALIAQILSMRADLLTIWPTQQTITWGERLIVPLMAFTIIAYLPIPAVHYLPWAAFAAANGQVLAFRRLAYEKVGGHLSVRKNIVEDMSFAYAIKRFGLRLRMADGNGLIVARMYRNWQEARDGFAKNILGGHGGSVLFLLFSTFFHLSLFIFAPLWLAYSLFTLHFSAIALILTSLGILIRALTAAVTHQRVLDALLMPLSATLMTMVAIQALQWHFGAGPQWKGRSYART